MAAVGRFQSTIKSHKHLRIFGGHRERPRADMSVRASACGYREKRRQSRHLSKTVEPLGPRADCLRARRRVEMSEETKSIELTCRLCDRLLVGKAGKSEFESDDMLSC